MRHYRPTSTDPIPLAMEEAFARLHLLVLRLIDADLLLPEDADALFLEAEATLRSLEAGDVAEGRHHIAQITDFTVALVQTQVLSASEGQALLEGAQGILPSALPAHEASLFSPTLLKVSPSETIRKEL